MADLEPRDVHNIKKYSNRRYYDTTRSRHITLREMHNLICEGQELKITDGKSGADITNVVLTQIILERDPPKLDIFPSQVLHQMIRTQREYLGTVVEQFFAQALQVHQSSQGQWLRFLRNTLGAGSMMPPNPLEWTRSFMETLTPQTPREEPRPPDAQGERPPVGPVPDEVEALRNQVEELTRTIERLSG